MIPQAVFTECVVATDGNADGNGSEFSPITMARLLALAPTMWPGVTVRLRGGTYSGKQISLLAGNINGSIVIQPYPGEAVVIDGNFEQRGASVTLKNLRAYDSDFTNRQVESGSALPPGTDDGMEIAVNGHDVMFINNIIHDCSQGMIATHALRNFTAYGNIVFYNGWSASDRGHGHGIYASNRESSGGWKKFIDNIIFWNFGYGLHLYTEGVDANDEYLYDLRVDGCTLFQNGILYGGANYGSIIGGGGPGTTVRISSMKNCCLYQDKLRLGGQSTGCTDFVLQDNVIVGDVTMLYYSDNLPTISGNKFYGAVAILDGDNGGQAVDHESLFPNNEYYASGIPDHISLRGNVYDSNVAYLTIFNGSQIISVNVNVADLFNDGDTVLARNAQDYWNDVQNLSVIAGNIIIDMLVMNRTIATPQGWTSPASTFPAFGCFVLEKL